MHLPKINAGVYEKSTRICEMRRVLMYRPGGAQLPARLETLQRGVPTDAWPSQNSYHLKDVLF